MKKSLSPRAFNMTAETFCNCSFAIGANLAQDTCPPKFKSLNILIAPQSGAENNDLLKILVCNNNDK